MYRLGSGQQRAPGDGLLTDDSDPWNYCFDLTNFDWICLSCKQTWSSQVAAVDSLLLGYLLHAVTPGFARLGILGLQFRP